MVRVVTKNTGPAYIRIRLPLARGPLEPPMTAILDQPPGRAAQRLAPPGRLKRVLNKRRILISVIFFRIPFPRPVCVIADCVGHASVHCESGPVLGSGVRVVLNSSMHPENAHPGIGSDDDAGQAHVWNHAALWRCQISRRIRCVGHSLRPAPSRRWWRCSEMVPQGSVPQPRRPWGS